MSTKPPGNGGDGTGLRGGEVIEMRRPPRTPGRQPASGRKPPPRGARTTAKNIRVAERRVEVLNLRRAGISFTRIAELIREKFKMPKYTRADAAGDVRIAMDGIVDEPARELLAEELSRLEGLTAAVWSKAMDRNHPEQLGAVMTILRIMERRARYLGLDSPVRHDLTGGDRDEVAVNLSDPGEVALAGLDLLDQIATDKDRQLWQLAERQLTGATIEPSTG